MHTDMAVVMVFTRIGVGWLTNSPTSLTISSASRRNPAASEPPPFFSFIGDSGVEDFPFSFFYVILSLKLFCSSVFISFSSVDFLGTRRMETTPTSIEVVRRPTLGQSDEPSDLSGSLSPTPQHRCTHVLVYTAPGSPRRSPDQLWTRPSVA